MARHGDPPGENGSVYKLTRSNGGWTASVLYSFPGGDGGFDSQSGVAFDSNGNLWGTTYFGGVKGCGSPGSPFTCGVLFELMPAGSGWIGNTVYQFDVAEGGNPLGNLIPDQCGKFLWNHFRERRPRRGHRLPGDTFQRRGHRGVFIWRKPQRGPQR